MTEAERYCLGLLTEEMCEAGCHIGRAERFGLDTLGEDGISERAGLTKELGDVLAAIRFAEMHGMVDATEVADACDTKLAKLLDPSNVDNLGRQLAPTPPGFIPGHHCDRPQREWRP